MIEDLEHQQQLNSEVEKYKREMRQQKLAFDFISIDFNIDMREAQVRYREEWKNNVGGIKTHQVSFSQWLDMKKFEATQFYIKHSDYYLGF